MSNKKQKVTTFITFDNRAEEAVNFYCSIFEDAEILSMNRYESGDKGSVINAAFRIYDQVFMAMDVPGGFPIGHGISLFVDCETQAEVDQLWDALAEGGEIMQCGWLTDKFGVSWQIIPAALSELMTKGSDAQREAVMNAMLQMKKIIVPELERAFKQAA
ncbi:MAG: VOC family protein [Anaerolineales bacterium]|nr:VOC family protein [Anaerolineales bacterium]